MCNISDSAQISSVLAQRSTAPTAGLGPVRYMTISVHTTSLQVIAKFEIWTTSVHVSGVPLRYMEPPFGGRGGRRGQRWHHSKERWWFGLSIVTVALSITIRPQFAIECLRRSNQQGWITFGQNFRVFPLE